MPRSVQITKEKILTAALAVLIRDGYSAVNIKSIAKELKCSTQPIAWQFGNMDNMREALTQEAVAYANQKMMPTLTNCIEAFWQVGHAYINLAFDTPNLFRFVYMGESKNYGSIAKGKVANFFITTPLPSVYYIPYAYTTPIVNKVVLGGKVL